MHPTPAGTAVLAELERATRLAQLLTDLATVAHLAVLAYLLPSPATAAALTAAQEA